MSITMLWKNLWDKMSVIYMSERDKCSETVDNKSLQSGEKDRISEIAYDKLLSLVNCDNERVALAAAKEIITLKEKDFSDTKDIDMEVTIKIV